jgi:hypothetical protein
MEKMWAMPPKPETTRGSEKPEEQKKESEISPEYIELVSQEVTKESGLLAKGMDRFPRLKKFAAAMALTTILAGSMAGSAEARDRSTDAGKAFSRGVVRVIDGSFDGLAKNFEDIFLRDKSGLTPREKARLVEKQMRHQQKFNDKLIKEQFELREQYEKQKQSAVKEYQRELRKAKTPEQMKMAEEKYKATLKAIDEINGIKTPEPENIQPDQKKSFPPPDRNYEDQTSRVDSGRENSDDKKSQEKPKWNVGTAEYHDEKIAD